MTYEQFEEIILYAIERHVSRDASISEEDRKWEVENAAKTISQQLRQWPIPLIPEDLSNE